MRKRRITGLIMSVCMAAGICLSGPAAGVWAEEVSETAANEEALPGSETEAEAAFSFSELENLSFLFTSGAGGWGEYLWIAPDGTFTGEYHDSEMGATGPGYPKGSVYGCTFHGRLVSGEQLSDKSWEIKVESIELDEGQADRMIEDEILFITTEPYGLKEGDTLLLMCPGYPVEDLPEGYLFWSHLQFEETMPEELPFYGLYNEAQDSGFVGEEPEVFGDDSQPEEAAADAVQTEETAEDAVQTEEAAADADADETEGLSFIPDPWIETDAEGFVSLTGIEFNIPDDAENIVYRFLEEEGMGEIDYTIGQDEFCARCKKSGAWEDISGLYYEKPDASTDCKISGREGIVKQQKDDYLKCTVVNCIWFDAAPGVMYSLTARTTDPEKCNITQMAEQIFVPVQTEA